MFQGLQLRDDGTPLACIKVGPNYNDTYKALLEELQEICPDACTCKSIPKLDSEERDTADSDMKVRVSHSLLVIVLNNREVVLTIAVSPT